MTVFQHLSPPFFPPQASIVTVIRLVNDAVDTIESEGTMSHPLCVSHLIISPFFYLSLVIVSGEI